MYRATRRAHEQPVATLRGKDVGDGPEEDLWVELSADDFTEDVVSAPEALAMISASLC